MTPVPPAPPPSQDATPGELVAGKYRLTRLIGRGGMGSVWEGVHATLGTRVAVKFIDAEHAASPEARVRFVNEARAAAMLRSKHVVQVHDHGLMEDGRPYIVMEFLAGEPLDRRLERVGRLSLQDTAGIVQQVCRALTKAHAAGIIHRDLKPENVFLVWDEEDHADIAKVVDFGIAKFTDPVAASSSGATRTGSVVGTPYYMSPEQARGLRSIDVRSDLWSVGVIAYRCVVGGLPFEGEAVGDLLVKICTAPLPVPSQVAPGVPAAFDAWFVRALERDPARRYASAIELAEALAASAGLAVRSLAADSASHLGATVAASAGVAAVSADQAPASVSASGASPGSAGQHPSAAQTHSPITQSVPRVSSRARSPLALVGVGAVVVVGGAAAAVVGFGGVRTPDAPAAESGDLGSSAAAAAADTRSGEPTVEPAVDARSAAVAASPPPASASGEAPPPARRPESTSRGSTGKPVPVGASPAATSPAATPPSVRPKPPAVDPGY
ncbi:MAG: serine/threonine protein kinase [Polyangiaceae bacterium]|nr:serine/threonine protein kinase [Polyangiaceae bacterium]